MRDTAGSGMEVLEQLRAGLAEREQSGDGASAADVALAAWELAGVAERLADLDATVLTGPELVEVTGRLEGAQRLLDAARLKFRGATEALCDPVWHPPVRDHKGRGIHLASPSRFATPEQRRATMVRDGGCVFPGYEAPPSWVDLPHVVHHHPTMVGPSSPTPAVVNPPPELEQLDVPPPLGIRARTAGRRWRIRRPR